MVGSMKRLAASVLALSLFTSAAWADGSTTTPANKTASATATTGSFSATLGAVTGRTNYLCGFVITSGGSSAASVVSVTVAGTISGTMNYAYVFPSSGQGVLGVAFPACIVASASNTAITVTVPGGGTGTTASLSVWGYVL